MPSAYRSSPRVEKTGSRSCSDSGRSAATQSALSRPASTAIVSHTSVAEITDGLDRAVDLLVAVRERDEHRLELARGDVDPALEQVAEQRRVALGVRPLRVVEVAHGRVGHEERRHRADPLDAAACRQAGLEARAAALELRIDGRVAEPSKDGQA